MIDKKVKEVDSAYSRGGSTKRSRFFDDISCSSNASARWTSILSCCWRRNRERTPNFKEYNPNEWDYIVEKLVVKRVPLALYATDDDYQEFIEAGNDKESSYGPVVGQAVQEMRDRQVYSAVPGVGSTLYFLKNKPRSDLSNRPSNKNLRFNRDEDLLDEDTVQAGPSNYNRRGMSHSRAREDELENEYLNQFSSLHPNLKDSERPPKDPHPLNPPRSKRSLAEDISEIASSTKKSPSVKNKKGKERSKHGTSDYIKVSDTPREISTALRNEEIPTRDKNSTKHTSSISQKIGSTSHSPYPESSSKAQGADSPGSRQIHAVDSPYDLQSKLSGKPNDRDSYAKSTLKAPQFKVHYVSPEPYSSSKLADLNSRALDKGVVSERKNHSELPDSRRIAKEKLVSNATSYTSEDIKNADLAGTSLRWKIIIKHHQPATASQTASESALGFSHSFPLPTLNDDFNRPKLMNANTEYYDKTRIDDRLNQ